MSARLVGAAFAAGASGAIVGREVSSWPRVQRVVHVALGRPIAYAVEVIDGTLNAKPGTSISNVRVEMHPAIDPEVLADRLAAAVASSMKVATGIHVDGGAA